MQRTKHGRSLISTIKIGKLFSHEFQKTHYSRRGLYSTSRAQLLFAFRFVYTVLFRTFLAVHKLHTDWLQDRNSPKIFPTHVNVVCSGKYFPTPRKHPSNSETLKTDQNSLTTCIMRSPLLQQPVGTENSNFAMNRTTHNISLERYCNRNTV